MAKRGPKPVVTDEKKKQFILMLSVGLPKSDAYTALQIDRMSFTRAAKSDPKFAQDIEAAKANGKAALFRKIASAREWTAARYLLEVVHRVYPEKPDTYTKEEVMNLGLRLTQLAMSFISPDRWDDYRESAVAVLGDTETMKNMRTKKADAKQPPAGGSPA